MKHYLIVIILASLSLLQFAHAQNLDLPNPNSSTGGSQAPVATSGNTVQAPPPVIVAPAVVQAATSPTPVSSDSKRVTVHKIAPKKKKNLIPSPSFGSL